MHKPRRVRAAVLAAGLLSGSVVATAFTSPAQAAESDAHDAGNAAAVAAVTKDHKYRNGVVTTLSATAKAEVKASAAGDAVYFDDMTYFGGTPYPGSSNVGVVTDQPKVYVVFWGSQWGSEAVDGNGNHTYSGDTAGMAPRLQEFYRGIGTQNENWSQSIQQYCQGVSAGDKSCPANAAHIPYPTGGVLSGVWYDNSAPVSDSADGRAIAQEAINAAQHFGNTATASNKNTQYIIVSPSGSRPDGWSPAGDSFCAWHSYNGDAGLPGGPVSSSYGNVAFTFLPYLPDAGVNCGANWVNSGSAGNLDGVSIIAGAQFQNTVTSPFPYWPSPSAQVPASGGWFTPFYDENLNLVGATQGFCAWIAPGKPGGAANVKFGANTFPVQGTWSNAAQSCVTGSAPMTSKPQVLYNPNNRNIEIYGINGGNLAEKYWNAGNGQWSGWNDFGAFDTDPYGNDAETTIKLTGDPAVFYNPGNHNVEIYANAGGHLVEKYWNASNGWSDWADFGAGIQGSPKVFYNQNNGNVEIYARGTSGNLVEKYWNSRNGQWSPWVDFGGSLSADPTVLYNPNNRNVEIYINTNGHLAERYWNSSNGQWSGWNDFGGTLTGEPTVLYNPNNRNIEIYGNSAGKLTEKYWNAGNGQWSDWLDFGGTLSGVPTVIYNPNNRNIEIYVATGTSTAEKYWNSSNGQWSGWNDLGSGPAGDPTVLYNPNNRNIEIYSLADGQYREKYWNAGNGQWSGWNLLV
ncbi:hypothetical protein [Dactylosporangium sp. CA-233914]|uniref:hypothetical protein n=1 Tax=Dactylosporangium sp. CA-233914 TaxID=3239934 RepID=UPI003D8C5661